MIITINNLERNTAVWNPEVVTAYKANLEETLVEGV